jgi:hypothetical protein
LPNTAITFNNFILYGAYHGCKNQSVFLTRALKMNKWVNEFKVVVILTSLFLTLGIVVWQIYNYIELGVWHPLSVLTVLRGEQIKWSFFQNAWIDLYKILDILPLSVFTLLIGIMALLSYPKDEGHLM